MPVPAVRGAQDQIIAPPPAPTVDNDIQSILAQLGPGATPEQVIAALMQDFTSTVGKSKESSKSAYQEAIAAIQKYYGDAAVGRGDDFASNFNELGGNLSNLGMNFEDSDLAKEWSANQQYLTEAADSALATDLAWFEKMQATQNDLYNALLVEMAAQQALGQQGAVASGGGGGSSRGRGGGGSSGGGSSTDPGTGTLTSQIVADDRTSRIFPEFMDEFRRHVASGEISPENAAIYLQRIRNADSPSDLNKDLIGALDTAAEAERVAQTAFDNVPFDPKVSRVFNGIMPDLSYLADIGRRGLVKGKAGQDRVNATEFLREQQELFNPLIDFAAQFDPLENDTVLYNTLSGKSTWKPEKQENVPNPLTVPNFDEFGEPVGPMSFADIASAELRRSNMERTLGRQTDPQFLARAYMRQNAPRDSGTGIGAGLSASGGTPSPSSLPAVQSLYDVSNTLDAVPDSSGNEDFFARAYKAQNSLAKRQAEAQRAEAQRQAQIQAAQKQAALTRLKQGNTGRVKSSAQLPAATATNPAPSGVGTFGQRVSGIPYYVAAPKKKSTRPRGAV